MKLCAVWILLFGAAFSLYAQSPTVVYMFIPPVTGNGSTPEDNDGFTDILNREIAAWNFILTETPHEEGFSLIGTLAPSDEEYEYEDEKYILSLVLLDKDGEELYGQGLSYTSPEEANRLLPSVLLQMISNVFTVQFVLPGEPEIEEEIDLDAWRNKLWYFGAGVFWNPRLYYGTKLETHLADFSFGISAEFHFLKYATGNWDFLKYAAVGTGVEFAYDWIVATPRSGDYHQNTLLQIPLTLNMVLKPGDKYLHQPYLGILFNIPLYPTTSPFPVSWKAGFQYGFKAGGGVAYADARFAMDFGKSGLSTNSPVERQYNRFMMYLGIGYKYNILELIPPDIFKKKIREAPLPETAEEDVEENEAAGENEIVEDAEIGEEIETVEEEITGEAAD